MTTFDADVLGELRGIGEISIRTGKHPVSSVVIWVVVADDQVFVRSVRGVMGRWYRDLAAGGPATLEFAGRRLSVQAIPVNDGAAIAGASTLSATTRWSISSNARKTIPNPPLPRISSTS